MRGPLQITDYPEWLQITKIYRKSITNRIYISNVDFPKLLRCFCEHLVIYEDVIIVSKQDDNLPSQYSALSNGKAVSGQRQSFHFVSV